jgi:hypothetical protein
MLVQTHAFVPAQSFHSIFSRPIVTIRGPHAHKGRQISAKDSALERESGALSDDGRSVMLLLRESGHYSIAKYNPLQ